MESDKVATKGIKKQPDQDDVLWKYMTFQKFVSFLINKQFHYSRLDQLEDTLEGINQRYLSTLSFHNQNEADSFINTQHPFYEKFFFKDSLKAMEEKFIAKQKHNYVLCWITNSRESAGMWNLYSESGGIALKLSFKEYQSILTSATYRFDFEDQISAIEYGLVDYKNFVDQNAVRSESFKVANTAFRKDKSFEHEKEFRVSVKTEKILKDDTKGIKQTFENLDDLPFQVVVHPKSTEWQTNNITRLARQYIPSVKVKLSELKLR